MVSRVFLNFALAGEADEGSTDIDGIDSTVLADELTTYVEDC